ncbi:uncharacterized protein V6R79_009235 [Siganus canaliculatus]
MNDPLQIDKRVAKDQHFDASSSESNRFASVIDERAAALPLVKPGANMLPNPPPPKKKTGQTCSHLSLKVSSIIVEAMLWNKPFLM